MRRVLLVRHASHDLVERVLCGRMPGVSLGTRGRAQAGALAEHLSDTGAAAVLCSPRARAAETAAPVAARLGLVVETAPELDEIDFGAWTGRSFDDLADDPGWRAWNEARADARPPGGESMAQAGARAAWLLHRLARQEAGPAILVSHCDVVRAVLLGLLGLGLDAYDRLAVAPASISELAVWPGGGRVVSMNERVAP